MGVSKTPLSGSNPDSPANQMTLITLNFIHGRPGCGKDTQADLLTMVTPHSLKASGIYRGAYTKQGQFARYHDLVAPFIKPLGQGIDMPAKTVNFILKDIVKRGRADGFSSFFICGLLRATSHKEAIDQWLTQTPEVSARHIYLATSEGKALAQSQSRNQRIDDAPLLMQARLSRFRSNSLPMLQSLEDEGRLTIVKADREIHLIHQELLAIIDPERQPLEFGMIARKEVV